MRLAARSADSAKDWPLPQFDGESPMSTPAEASSIRLSTPNASKRDRARATPAPIATAASMTIHATVTYSRRKASRMSVSRRSTANASVNFECPFILLLFSGFLRQPGSVGRGSCLRARRCLKAYEPSIVAEAT